MCVILAGAPWAGFSIHGPFSSSEKAEQYQNEFLYGEDFWWIMPLEMRSHATGEGS